MNNSEIMCVITYYPKHIEAGIIKTGRTPFASCLATQDIHPIGNLNDEQHTYMWLHASFLSV